MTPQTMSMSCKFCGHTWSETVELPITLIALTARVKGWMVCPKCGHDKKTYMGSPTPVEEVKE